jgi:hypothetical protein
MAHALSHGRANPTTGPVIVRSEAATLTGNPSIDWHFHEIWLE